MIYVGFIKQYLGQPWTVLGRAASLYTDPFIMLSGLLTTYSLVQQLDKSGKIDIKKEYLSRLLRYIFFYIIIKYNLHDI